jgi:4-hydroxy-4-methyl-2-oxoglutarate aldolase
VVIREIERADASSVKRLGAAGVATVHEAQGRVGLCQPYLRPIYPGATMAGPAVTALCTAGDNLMLHLAVECCQPGDVLVVGVTSECTQGFIGELLATSLRAHGVPGVIIGAGARDVAGDPGRRHRRRRRWCGVRGGGRRRSVAENAEERTQKEEVTREKLAKGELRTGIYGYRELASRLGITFIGG